LLRRILELLPIRRVKERESEEEPTEVTPTVIVGDLPRYKKTPNLVFIGSDMSAGKSVLASNMTVVVSALSRRPVYAVDLDIGSATMTKILPPPNFIEELARRVLNSDVRFANFADILVNGGLDSSVLIPIIKTRTMACNDLQIPVKYRFIPAYDPLRLREQEILLKSVSPRVVYAGTESLIDYFKKKVRENPDTVVVFDGKQKSNIGIEFEPLYRLLADESDVFIMPVKPPVTNFSALLASYSEYLDKMILVLNMVEPAHKGNVKLVLQTALKYDIPTFIIPYVQEDDMLVRRTYTAPALRSLSRPTAVHAGVIATYLNLTDDSLIRQYECNRVHELLRKYSRLLGGNGE